MKIFRFGDLYVEYISIENYDKEIEINFTNKIENAKKFNLDEVIIFDNILKALFHIDFEVVEYIEVKE